jgi:ribonuclease-3
MNDLPETIAAFAAANGLTFQDPALLVTALTHRSYLNEHPALDWEDNERLEYLGDAVLDFLLADHLYREMPAATEGEMTALRAALVRRETLARFAVRLGIGPAMLMGHGEVETGGRDRPATLCAAFEALIGAIYLDQGVDTVADFVFPLVADELSLARAAVLGKDPKSRLQELVQGRLGVTPRYRTVKAEGPDHAKTFTVEVMIGDSVCGEGKGPNKQLAAQQAAVRALAAIVTWPEISFGAG